MTSQTKAFDISDVPIMTYEKLVGEFLKKTNLVSLVMVRKNVIKEKVQFPLYCLNPAKKSANSTEYSTGGIAVSNEPKSNEDKYKIFRKEDKTYAESEVSRLISQEDYKGLIDKLEENYLLEEVLSEVETDVTQFQFYHFGLKIICCYYVLHL